MTARRTSSRRLGTALALVGLATGSGVVAAVPAAAAPVCDTSWLGGTGNWSDATHWSTGTTPRATENVCIVGADGSPAPVVTLNRSRSVRQVTVTGSQLLIVGAGTTLTARDYDIAQSSVAGLGTLTTSDGGTGRLSDVQLGAGLTVVDTTQIVFTGTTTLRGGAHIVGSGLGGALSFIGDVLVRDGDGNPANHISVGVSDLEVAAGQRVTIDVPLATLRTHVEVRGTLRLSHLDQLDTDGVLQSLTGTTYDGATFRADDAGRIVLARTVTTVGVGGNVADNGGFVTPDGASTFRDLTSVAGYYTRYQRPLTLAQPLDVTGGVTSYSHLAVPSVTVHRSGVLTASSPEAADPSTPAVVAPVVTVEEGGAVDVTSLRGRLESAGTTNLGVGAYGTLRLGSTASSTTALSRTTTVVNTARVAGRLRIALPGVRFTPPDGTQYVLMTASGGLTGQFSTVGYDRPGRGTVTLEYTLTQILATYHAPTPA